MITFEQLVESIQLDERVLSIGYNPAHEKYREPLRHELHDMIVKSYQKIGGYGGYPSGSPEESANIHDMISNSQIKAVRRNGKISAVNFYRQSFGRKSIASGTDGSEQGKLDYRKTSLEDHEHKRAWGEVSGASEHIKRKQGWPVLPHSKVKELLPGKTITPKEDGYYDRKIGNEVHTKIAIGHPDYNAPA